MKRMSIPLSVVLVCSALAGCSLSGGDPGPVVYVAGYHFNGVNVAAYWKDDGISVTEVDLYSDSNSEATDIYVDAGGTVYVSGYYFNGLEYVAAYWTDDGIAVTEHILHNTSDAQATGIFVGADGTVYVSGYYNDGTYDVAVYWVDDGSSVTPRVLHDTSNSAATDIHIDAGGVTYVSGYRSGPVAVVWVDNGAVSETSLAGPSDAYAVAVEETILFVAGRYAPSGTALAAYWTDSAWNNLSAVVGQAWDLVRYGGQTYTAGDYQIAGPPVGRKAAYWKNASVTELLGFLANTFAYGIFVFEGDVYVAGVQNDSVDPAEASAIYWHNGVMTDLSAGGGSRGNAIFVR